MIFFEFQGAGDCFCGTFAHFYIQNSEEDIVEIVRKSINAATLSVTKLGTQKSYPTLEELRAAKFL